MSVASSTIRLGSSMTFERLLVEVEDRSQGTDLVTQSVHRILARAADQGVQPFFGPGSAERASHEPSACA